jgi:hypothetical protein
VNFRIGSARRRGDAIYGCQVSADDQDAPGPPALRLNRRLLDDTVPPTGIADPDLAECESAFRNLGHAKPPSPIRGGLLGIDAFAAELDSSHDLCI